MRERATVATALAALLLLPAGTALAKVSAQQAARLGGGELTPVGAERAGNGDGIPEWTGGLTKPPRGWKRGGLRRNPFADDKKLFTIDASNVDQYAARLSPGQAALLRKVPGYTLDVYPTRRSCGYPEWVYEATKRNATLAELGPEKTALVKGWHPFLFPIPGNGAEAIWNHEYSFFTEGIIQQYATMTPTKGGDMTPARSRFTIDGYIFSPQVESLEQADGRSASILLERFAPPRLAGQVVLVHEMVNDYRRAWVYNPGQRRVIRAPTVEYDNPMEGTENLMTTDQSKMFNGLIDRYDWKLAGKKELYVPYNSFGINYGQGISYSEALGPAFPRRDLMRYELHRVWVVEATLRKGKRHVYRKRVFYLDEDSWLAMIEDIYDDAGKLWRVMEGTVVPIAEVPTCNLAATFSYDLEAGRYAADRMRIEEPPDDWLAGREGRIPSGVFTPDALRRRGRR